MQVSLLLVLLTLVGGSIAAGSWGYGKTHGNVYGPADWGQMSKDCNGRSQSPVDIEVTPDDHRGEDRPLRIRTLQRYGYTTGIMTNNGHSPTFNVETGGATLRNPINGQTYKLAQFHFHFGCDDSVGSEHTVNGKSYPGELHLVFFNTKYGDIGTAASKSDGLSVIGVFLEKACGVSRSLLRIAYRMAGIASEGASTKKFGIYLTSLVYGLNSGERDYYSYKGSLTTPGCYESVSWFVLKRPMRANSYVLQSLRKLKAEHGYKAGKMCNNFRPTQPLYGRKIAYYQGDD